MTIKILDNLILGGTEWKVQPFKFDVSAINEDVLPPEYTRLDCIKSIAKTGAYIDLDLEGACKFIMTVRCTEIRGSSAVVLSGTPSSDARTWFGEALATKKWGFASAPANYTNIDATTKVTAILDFKLSGTTTGDVNGEIITIGSNSQFSSWSLGSTNSTYTALAEYYPAIAIQNDAIVRNIVPVKRNADDYVGMYDFVSKTLFLPNTQASFTAG